MSFELSDNQTIVMIFVKFWVNTQKTPVPFKEIDANMRKHHKHRRSTEVAITGLIKKGYIRKATSGGRLYIQIRNI